MALSKVGKNQVDQSASLTVDSDLTVDTNTLYVDSTNNRVGVGTASPTSALDVTGTITTSEGITYDGISTMIIDQAINAGAMILRTGTNCYMRFDTNGSNERMRLDNDGNLLLQKTSATNSGAGTYFQVPTTPTTMPVYLHFCKTFSGARDAIDFNHNGSRVGSVQFDNTSTSYNTSSDYRLKTAVNYDWDATTRLKQLRPARFKWIANGDDAVPVDGFLAHEVQSVVPEAISGTHNEVDDDGNPVYQGIDQSKLTPLLTKALIEAVEKIEQLEARITALEAN